MGTKANLIVAAAAGACTAVLTQVGNILHFITCFPRCESKAEIITQTLPLYFVICN